jgi:hypothetical protein
MSDDISLTEAERSAGIVRCDACPVHVPHPAEGRAGACDRYANRGRARLVRVDPLDHPRPCRRDLAARRLRRRGSEAWSGRTGQHRAGAFITRIGATTTYPDYKPAPFIVSSNARRRRSWSPS